MADEDKTPVAIQFVDLAPGLKFGCWVVVVLVPFLRLVNGAAVTDDQWWIQAAVSGMALVGALALRIVQVRHHRKPR